MKFALIGCGRIAINHLKAALDNGLEVVALCDVDKTSIEKLLKNVSPEDEKIKRYSDYKEMLRKEPDIELIAIATPSNLHASMALDCIEVKKHLIIEKPVALSIDEANLIEKRANAANIRVSVCHQNRFNTAIQALRKAVEDERFGKLSHGSVSVRWNRDADYYKQAPWRGTWEQDGGCLMNQCIHGIDLLLWMMNSKVLSVYAQTRKRFHDYIEAEDIGVAVLSFANGSVATIEGTTNIYPKNLQETLCVFGQKGTAVIGGASANQIETWHFDAGSADDKELSELAELVPNIYGNGHRYLYADIIEAITEEREPYISAAAGRDALEVVLAIYKSQQSNLPVSLPLEKFSSKQMRGEFS